MKRVFSHKSKLNVQGDGAIEVCVPPWCNRHQLYTEVVTASVAATGVITFAGVPNVGDTITIDGKTWTFTVDGVQAWTIAIGATAAACVTNTVTAINRDYGANTQIGDREYVTAADGAGDTVDITYSLKGTVGNAIVFTESATNVSMDGSGVLSGGVGDGTVEGAAAGTGATALWYHKAGTSIAGTAKDFTNAAEVEVITGMLDKITITPSSLTGTSSFRIIVNSWKE